jgi:hypothetical protein
MSTLKFELPCSLIPTRITKYTFPRFVTQIAETEDGLESRQLMSKLPIGATIEGTFTWESAEGVSDLYEFLNKVVDDHQAFYIPDDHPLWEFIPNSFDYRSYLPYNAWRIIMPNDKTGIEFTPEGCYNASFSLTIKNLVGEGELNPRYQ